MNKNEALKQYPDLYGANLREADLCEANLCGANLREADLCGANLRGANLCEADLPEKFKIARLDFGDWSICVTPEKTSIGCQSHPNTDWLKWMPKDVADFEDGAKEFWTLHRKAICAVIKDVMQ